MATHKQIIRQLLANWAKGWHGRTTKRLYVARNYRRVMHTLNEGANHG